MGKKTYRLPSFILFVCLVMFISRSAISDSNNVVVNINCGAVIIDQTQINFESLAINVSTVQPKMQGFTNDKLIQFLANGLYQAYDKDEVTEYIPQSILNSFRPSQLRGFSASHGYQYVLFGRYYQDFNDQPILWRVLTVKSGNALLLSEYILDTRPFDTNSNAWETSDLRSWLNGDFNREAFSQTERNAILDGGSIGKVFILSDAELTNSSYGFNPNKYAEDSFRRASGSMYSYSNGLWNVADSDYTNYYARSAPNSTNVDLVTSRGKFSLAKITRNNVGIRPAVWVNISNLPFTNGDGGITYPFQ